MFLLDTNVVSELRKVRLGKADAQVASWADSVDANALYISVITLQELEIGVLLAERRDPMQGAVLRSWLNLHVIPAFADRILPVDTAVVQRSARLHVPDPRPVRDGLIAATALVHGMTVVTRNVSDFEPTGVAILNPWGTWPTFLASSVSATPPATPTSSRPR
jgi:toxin FitB